MNFCLSDIIMLSGFYKIFLFVFKISIIQSLNDTILDVLSLEAEGNSSLSNNDGFLMKKSEFFEDIPQYAYYLISLRSLTYNIYIVEFDNILIKNLAILIK